METKELDASQRHAEMQRQRRKAIERNHQYEEELTLIVSVIDVILSERPEPPLNTAG